MHSAKYINIGITISYEEPVLSVLNMRGGKKTLHAAILSNRMPPLGIATALYFGEKQSITDENKQEEGAINSSKRKKKKKKPKQNPPPQTKNTFEKNRLCFFLILMLNLVLKIGKFSWWN